MDDKKRSDKMKVGPSENKAVEPATENKAPEPPKKEEPSEEKKEETAKTVRVQVKRGRAVTGIGGAGATKRIDSELARQLAGEGLVTIL